MAPKERPILFSGPMVKAILDGRKTQTRRVVKPRGFDVNCYPRDKCGLDRVGVNADGMLELRVQTAVDDDEIHLFSCPYGKPGDQLWVRETWCRPVMGDLKNKELPIKSHDLAYRADCGVMLESWFRNYWMNEADCKWRPSIHMPRACSRITLEVTGVRVERLQDISESDAKAEGAHPGGFADRRAVPFFKVLWESINGAGSWAANPWVWVVEFKQVKGADHV